MRIPEGFEQRICTYVLEFKADGTCVSPTVLIFKGTGKKISPEELAEYSKLPDIVVLWQRKAWIDTDTEKKVLTVQHLAEIKRLKKLYSDAGKTFPGALLTHDRGPGHDAECVRNFLFVFLSITRSE